MTINIIDLHTRMTRHLFPAFSSDDERFLALAICGEAGELANFIKKRWRDGTDYSEEIRDEIADIRVYLELMARCFAIDGEKLDEMVQAKLEKVVARMERGNGDGVARDGGAVEASGSEASVDQVDSGK